MQAAVERAIEEDRLENDRHGTAGPRRPEPGLKSTRKGLAGGNVCRRLECAFLDG